MTWFICCYSKYDVNNVKELWKCILRMMSSWSLETNGYHLLSVIEDCMCNVFSYRNVPKFSDRQIWANSADSQRVYTVCNVLCIFWMHYSKENPSCSTFRVITANFWVSEILGFLQYFRCKLMQTNENVKRTRISKKKKKIGHRKKLLVPKLWTI